MARTVTIVVAVLLVLALATGLWLWWRPHPKSVEPSDERRSEAAKETAAPLTPSLGGGSTKAPLSVASVPSEAIDTPTPDAEQVTAALQSMRSSLSQGDARTPELAPQYEREKPSAAVLANPDLYTEYELGETRKIASIYLSMLSQIPVLRARIEAARTAGSKSSEELTEAEEALAKLEELKREIERDHPDMLPTTVNIDTVDPALSDDAPTDE